MLSLPIENADSGGELRTTVRALGSPDATALSRANWANSNSVVSRTASLLLRRQPPCASAPRAWRQAYSEGPMSNARCPTMTIEAANERRSSSASTEDCAGVTVGDRAGSCGSSALDRPGSDRLENPSQRRGCSTVGGVLSTCAANELGRVRRRRPRRWLRNSPWAIDGT